MNPCKKCGKIIGTLFPTYKICNECTSMKKKHCQSCGIVLRDDRRKYCSIWCRNHVDEPLAPFTIPDETQTVPIGYNYKTKVLLWG